MALALWYTTIKIRVRTLRFNSRIPSKVIANAFILRSQMSNVPVGKHGLEWLVTRTENEYKSRTGTGIVSEAIEIDKDNIRVGTLTQYYDPYPSDAPIMNMIPSTDKRLAYIPGDDDRELGIAIETAWREYRTQIEDAYRSRRAA